MPVSASLKKAATGKPYVLLIQNRRELPGAKSQICKKFQFILLLTKYGREGYQVGRRFLP
jgi:hypothetical protein